MNILREFKVSIISDSGYERDVVIEAMVEFERDRGDRDHYEPVRFSIDSVSGLSPDYVPESYLNQMRVNLEREINAYDWSEDIGHYLERAGENEAFDYYHDR